MRRALLPAIVAGCIAAALGCSEARSAADPPQELLPDLDQAPPQAIAVTAVTAGGRGRYVLTFGSAVDNVGAGPLVIDAHRSSRSEPEMRAVQVVRLTDGSRKRIPVGAVVRYVRAETHEHWHVLEFDRYELRRASNGRLVQPDRKSGFCLGDRYNTAPESLPNEPENAVFTTECGKGLPRLLGLREGISVGYGDDYVPTLEGQYLDLTGAKAGRYLLVHRVNPERTLLESSYANNAASALLELSRPLKEAAPVVTILAFCPDSARCTEPE